MYIFTGFLNKYTKFGSKLLVLVAPSLQFFYHKMIVGRVYLEVAKTCPWPVSENARFSSHFFCSSGCRLVALCVFSKKLLLQRPYIEQFYYYVFIGGGMHIYYYLPLTYIIVSTTKSV